MVLKIRSTQKSSTKICSIIAAITGKLEGWDDETQRKRTHTSTLLTTEFVLPTRNNIHITHSCELKKEKETTKART